MIAPVPVNCCFFYINFTNVIKDSPLDSKPNDVTKRWILNQTISTQQSTNTVEPSPNVLAEEEVSRMKAHISNIWETKLERRKDAYWNYIKNKGHNETFSK